MVVLGSTTLSLEGADNISASKSNHDYLASVANIKPDPEDAESGVYGQEVAECISH